MATGMLPPAGHGILFFNDIISAPWPT